VARGFKVRAHYLSGTQQRSLQADRIFALAARQFQAALDFAPDDKLVLGKYEHKEGEGGRK
jgi:hypothetical protein